MLLMWKDWDVEVEHSLSPDSLWWSPTKSKDEWLQGGGFVWHPEVPSHSANWRLCRRLGAGLCQLTRFWGAWAVFCFGGSLMVPVASAPAFCGLALMVHQANQESALVMLHWWDSTHLGQDLQLSTAVLHSFSVLS